MRRRITVKFLFAAAQSLLAFSAIIMAILLRFNLSNIQLALNIPNAAVDFYIAMFIIFGFVFLISGLFLIYDWWEA